MLIWFRPRVTWRLPLHIPVAVLFSLLIVGVSAAISLPHFRQTRLLLEAANTELFRNLSENARQTIADANRAVRRTFILLSASSLSDAESYGERLRFLPELTGLLDADPLIESVMIGYGDGDFLLVRRAGQGDPAAWSVLNVSKAKNAKDASSAQITRFDAKLRLIDVTLQPGERYEPRLSQWYRQAASSDGLVVTEPYAFAHSGERGVTFARRNGSEVFGVNVAFSGLSRLLAVKPTTPSTRLQLVGPGRTLLVSTAAPAQPGPSDQPGANEVIRQAVAHDDSFSARATSISDSTGRLWRVSIAPLQGFGDASWALLVATPDDEIFAEAYRQRQNSILFTIIAVLASVPLAWALSRLLTTPLHRLAHVARTLSTLQFQPQPATHSVILEIDQLAGAMTMMRMAIARFLEMGRDLGSARDVKSVLAEVAGCAREISAASWSIVEVVNEDLQAGEAAATFRSVSEASIDSSERTARTAELALLLLNVEGPVSLLASPPDGANTHFLGVPLRTPEGLVLGTLLLAGQRSRNFGLARPEVAGFLVALAGTAAVALENQRLLKGRKALLQGVIGMIADAIDAKSPYTGGHCRRVTQLTRGLALAAHQADSGPLADFRLDASGWEALEIASGLHDCGKLTTPEYVIDKATKLETIYNRIHEIRTRFEVLKRDADIAYWRGLANGEDDLVLRATRDAAWRALDDDFAFVAHCNQGSEAMAPQALQRLDEIARRRWVRTLDKRSGLSNAEMERLDGTPASPLPIEEPLLSDQPEHIIARNNSALFAQGNPWGFAMRAPEHLYDHGEMHNLNIRRGTLNNEERFKIKEHIVQTIIMLARLPFPSDLAAVPEMAAGHHETTDGRGYPRGLHASDMSVTARIMAIADIFEALTAPDRPYRNANTAPEALAIMAEMSKNKVIDADLFALFVEAQVWRDGYPPAHPVELPATVA